MSRSRNEPPAKRPPARTPEDREQQLIGLAVDLAEKQLRDGTAPASTVNHYIKLASSREQLEQTKLKAEGELATARVKALGDAADMKVMYAKAIDAMRIYQGGEPLGEDHED